MELKTADIVLLMFLINYLFIIDTYIATYRSRKGEDPMEKGEEKVSERLREIGVREYIFRDVRMIRPIAPRKY